MFPIYNTFDWIHTQSTLPKRLDLVTELLRRGGDPNIYVGGFSTTIWIKFLLSAA